MNIMCKNLLPFEEHLSVAKMDTHMDANQVTLAENKVVKSCIMMLVFMGRRCNKVVKTKEWLCATLC
eukprot:c7405_g1_i1 orf=518-718(-)